MRNSGELAKLRQTTVSFIPSVRLSAWLPPYGFLQNLTFEYFFFENASRKFKFSENLTQITGTLHEDQCTILIISRSVSLRLRNVSDRSCRENRNTHFVFRNFPPKIVPFMRNVEKYDRAGQATDDNIIRHMRIACWITKATDRHSEYVLHIAFPRQKWLRERNSVLRCLPVFLLFERNYLWFPCVNIHLINFCNLY